MNLPRSSPFFLLSFCLLAMGAFVPGAHARRAFHAPYSSEAGRTQWGERNREFGRLWLSRFEDADEAARGILPFALEKVDGNADLRERAVVALGRIESPIAQKPLEALLQEALDDSKNPLQNPRPSSFPEDEISPSSLKFALARIQARDLKGEEKLDFVARALGTTWEAVRQQGRYWKQRLNDPKQLASYDYQSSLVSPRQNLEEFAQLLHDMGQKGEDVKELGAEDLLVWPDKTKMSNAAQSVILTANMTQSEAIDFWLRRSLPPQPDSIRRTGSLSPQAFVDLGPPAIKALKAALQDLLERTRQDSSIVDGMRGVGPYSMFEAAAASGDSEFIPILQGFVELHAGSTGTVAKQALADLKSGEGAAILPRPKLYFGPVE